MLYLCLSIRRLPLHPTPNGGPPSIRQKIPSVYIDRSIGSASKGQEKMLYDACMYAFQITIIEAADDWFLVPEASQINFFRVGRACPVSLSLARPERSICSQAKKVNNPFFFLAWPSTGKKKGRGRKRKEKNGQKKKKNRRKGKTSRNFWGYYLAT